MQDLVINWIFGMGETALMVGSWRMTGTSFTSEEAAFRHLSPVHNRRHLNSLIDPVELHPAWKGLACVHDLGFCVPQFLLLWVGRVLLLRRVRSKSRTKRHPEKHKWKTHLFISLWQELLAVRKQCTVVFYSFSIFRGMTGSIKMNFDGNQRLIF